ncbi:hypothetical protein [Radicibacter daui]|uniref:hypothetical protein n=1 Tax=Radicibacter daui TaxID=3064829 RepID=UPI004046E462
MPIDRQRASQSWNKARPGAQVWQVSPHLLAVSPPVRRLFLAKHPAAVALLRTAVGIGGILVGAILRAGFGVWRRSRAEIIQFGFLPQGVATGLLLYVSWLGSRLNADDWGIGAMLGVFGVLLVAWGLHSLVISRWARFCLLGEWGADWWWSIVPDAAARRTLVAQLRVLVLILLVMVPLGFAAGCATAVLSQAIGNSPVINLLPLLLFPVALCIGIRNAAYPVARAINLNESISSVWQALKGRRSWSLLGSVVLAGLIYLLVTVLAGMATGFLLGFGAALAGGGQPMISITILVARGVAGFLVSLLFTPVFVVMIAYALREALITREKARAASEAERATEE